MKIKIKWLPMFVLGLFSFAANSQAFGDISSNDPFRPMYEHIRDLGIIQTYSDGLFHPEKIITRVEALTIAMRAGNIRVNPDFGGDTGFKDVNPNEWYAAVIAQAKTNKIIINKNQAFYPNRPVSKAEFLAFLFRSTNVDFKPYFAKTRNVASDVPFDAWFAPHFSYAKKYQIAYLPPSNQYSPLKALSRKEVAIMTYRQLKVVNGDKQTLLMVELQAEIQQFMDLVKTGKNDSAEFHLHRIMEINNSITRTRNNNDAVAAKALSKSMTHLTDSLRTMRYQKKLMALENLMLAHRQALKSAEKSEKLRPFADQMNQVVNDMIYQITNESYLGNL